MPNLNSLRMASEKLLMTRPFLQATIEAGLLNVLKIGERVYISDAEIARFKSSIAA
jgi:hypothetical protein